MIPAKQSRFLSAKLPVDLINRLEDRRSELTKRTGRRVSVKSLIQLALEEYLKRRATATC